MLTREFTQAGHTVKFVVVRTPLGWDVRQEQDSRLVKEAHYSDWHRVERAVQTFELLNGESGGDPRDPKES
jgi:hypothetical protein